MEGVEKAYAAVRLALAVREMLTEGLLTTTKVAGAGTRMATDAVETASSVSKSGIRAAADGVAAFAKTLASLPFPFNIAAGAVVLAALAGAGVAIAGGGSKGASASAEADKAPAKPTDYANQNSPYSVMQTQPGYGTNQTVGYANDNRSAQPALTRGGDTFAPVYHINIEGNADENTVQQFREALAETENRAVARSRVAAQEDRVAAAGRQRIGSIN